MNLASSSALSVRMQSSCFFILGQIEKPISIPDDVNKISIKLIVITVVKVKTRLLASLNYLCKKVTKEICFSLKD